jgi:diacylglycerol kinase (ATP)
MQVKETRRGTRPIVVFEVASARDADAGRVLVELQRGLEADQVEWVEFVDFNAAPSVGAQVPTLVACGGDSVVRACINQVAGTTTALGVCPLGGSGSVAAALGVNPSPEADPADSLHRALTGDLRRVDLGEINGEVFVTAAGYGAAAILGSRGRRTGAQQLWSTLRRLPERLAPVTIHVDGVQRFAGRSPVVLIGNGRYLVHADTLVEVFPEADLADAELDIAVLRPRQLLDWSVVVWRLLMGRPQPMRLLERFKGSWVQVRTTVERPVDVDGYGGRPTTVLDVRVWPGGLLLRETVNHGAISSAE